MLNWILGVLTIGGLAYMIGGHPPWPKVAFVLWLLCAGWLLGGLGVGAYHWLFGLAKTAASVERPPSRDGGGRLEISTLRTRLPTTQELFAIDVYVANNGENAANFLGWGCILQLTDSPNQISQDDEQMTVLLTHPLEAIPNIEEVQPHSSASLFFTRSDPNVTQQVIDDVEQGKRLLYVYAALKWRDQTMSNDEIGLTEMCGYFSKDTDFKYLHL